MWKDQRCSSWLSCSHLLGIQTNGGLAPYRTGKFLNEVTMESLENASLLFFNNKTPSLIQIKKLGLPQFSAISFTSKIRMFLSPEDSAVLDSQILKMRKVCQGTVLDQFKLSGASISISKVNNDAYESWCDRLIEIRNNYFPQKRAVDIERAFLSLFNGIGMKKPLVLYMMHKLSCYIEMQFKA